MKIVSLGLTILTLVACSNVSQKNKGKKYFANLLKDVDRVQLTFFNHGDTLAEAITDQTEINIYKELITGRRDPKQKFKCDSTGEIIFLSKNEMVLHAWFSSRATGSKFDRACVTYTVEPYTYGAALTVRSGQDIDDYYYKLRSTANRMVRH